MSPADSDEGKLRVAKDASDWATELTNAAQSPVLASEPLPSTTALGYVRPRRAMSDLIKILFVGVNPNDTASLDLAEEAETIQARLRQSKFRERFEVVQRWKTEASALPGLLMEHSPQILHFSGHGTVDGRLYFRGPKGRAVPADDATIARLFGLLGGVRCVVLNACHSTEQARLIARHVDVVVGMSTEIRDQDAIAFAAGFYEGLGYGKDVQTAFELGRLQIGLLPKASEDPCVLHVREGVDPTRLLLLEPAHDEAELSEPQRRQDERRKISSEDLGDLKPDDLAELVKVEPATAKAEPGPKPRTELYLGIAAFAALAIIVAVYFFRPDKPPPPPVIDEDDRFNACLEAAVLKSKEGSSGLRADFARIATRLGITQETSVETVDDVALRKEIVKVCETSFGKDHAVTVTVEDESQRLVAGASVQLVGDPGRPCTTSSDGACTLMVRTFTDGVKQRELRADFEGRVAKHEVDEAVLSKGATLTLGPAMSKCNISFKDNDETRVTDVDKVSVTVGDVGREVPFADGQASFECSELSGKVATITAITPKQATYTWDKKTLTPNLILWWREGRKTCRVTFINNGKPVTDLAKVEVVMKGSTRVLTGREKVGDKGTFEFPCPEVDEGDAGKYVARRVNDDQKTFEFDVFVPVVVDQPWGTNHGEREWPPNCRENIVRALESSNCLPGSELVVTDGVVKYKNGDSLPMPPLSGRPTCKTPCPR